MNLVSDFVTAAEEMLAAFGNCGSPRQQAAANELSNCVKSAREFPATPELIQKARDQYANDDLNIDDDAILSPSDDGTWVSAWVWVYKSEEVEGDAE